MVHNEDPTAKTKVLNVQKKLNWRAEKMAQWLMCLPHKPEDHDSDPWNSYKFWVISASEEQDQGNNPRPAHPRASWLAWPDISVGSGADLETASLNEVEEWWRVTPDVNVGSHLCRPTHTQVCPHRCRVDVHTRAHHSNGKRKKISGIDYWCKFLWQSQVCVRLNRNVHLWLTPDIRFPDRDRHESQFG